MAAAVDGEVVVVVAAAAVVVAEFCSLNQQRRSVRSMANACSSVLPDYRASIAVCAPLVLRSSLLSC